MYSNLPDIKILHLRVMYLPPALASLHLPNSLEELHLELYCSNSSEADAVFSAFITSDPTRRNLRKVVLLMVEWRDDMESASDAVPLLQKACSEHDIRLTFQVKVPFTDAEIVEQFLSEC